MSKMQQGFVEVNGVPTKVITWGRWIEEIPKSNPENIVICIPGNPGLPNFYTEFLQTLHEELNYTVWIMAHAGHEPLNDFVFNNETNLQKDEKLYGLEDQINHKVEFFKKYVPENARVHLIGHSVGAYIILKLLEDPAINKKIIDNYLLFPTIEHMVTSPNGKVITRVFPFVPFVIFTSWIFTILPSIIQYTLISLFMQIQSIPKMHLQNITNVVNPEVLKQVFFLASQEMDTIIEREKEVLLNNKSKIKLYYGMTDGWVPLSYRDKLMMDIPGIEADVCYEGYEHAFVLRHSQEVGHKVANWIKQKNNPS